MSWAWDYMLARLWALKADVRIVAVLVVRVSLAVMDAVLDTDSCNVKVAGLGDAGL